MRKQVVLFLLVVLTVYTLINYYLFVHIMILFPDDNGSGNLICKIVFWSLAAAYPAGRILGRIWLSRFTDALTLVGSFWFAFMLYMFLGALLTDILAITGWVLVKLSVDLSFTILKQMVMIVSLGATLLLILYGLINARNPRIKRLDLVLDKQMNQPGRLTIAVATDLHLGTVVARRMARKITGKINSLDPDIILLAGDVVDEDLAPVVRFNLGECLRQLRAGMGVYAITGNHEYIGGVSAACKYLEEHQVRVIRDEWIRLENGLYLVGREDRDRSRFTGQKRLPLAEIVKGIDKRYPVIMMDHQPFSLREAEMNEIDLSLSGHTHHGQMWPLNYITRAIYEVSWGYKKRGITHYYVSCGAGTWGPPVRIGNRPEIIEIKITAGRGLNQSISSSKKSYH